MYWNSLVNINDSFRRKQLIDGTQSMQYVKDSFDDEKFKKNNPIVPLKIMNVFINTVTEDLRKAPPNAEVKALDPTAMQDRNVDMALLANRKKIEKDQNDLRKKVNFPPYKMGYDKFKGNVQDFDKMGFDDGETDDRTFFEQNLHRLNYEIAAQSVVNAVLKLSRVDEGTLNKYVRDVMANGAMCGQSYVDEITGEIKGNDYIYPEEFYGIYGDREDGGNDICHGWQKQMTVGEFLSRAGKDFDWYKKWPELVAAINYCCQTKYTGFVRSGFSFECCGNQNYSERARVGEDWTSNLCDYSLAYAYKVYMGYIEYPAPTATTTYLQKKSDPTNFVFVPYSLNVKNKKERKEYEKESWYQEVMLKSYFLATTMTSQYIYNFGTVYHHLKDGQNDEYARWTLWYYRQPGTTAAEVAEPFIRMANFAFYRIQFLLWKAKPEDEQYVINELLELSKGFKQLGVQSGTNNSNPLGQDILDQIIQWQRTKSIKIRAYPRIDGHIAPKLEPIHNDQRGPDPLMQAMISIVMWTQQQIAYQIGLNPIRFGANPPARESYKTEQAIAQNSQTSTSYIYRMFQYMKEHMATIICLYAQDIAYYKDALSYKWLVRLVGEDNVESLKALDEIAAHRYAIFTGDFNQAAAKQEIKEIAFELWKQGKLTTEQVSILTLHEDYKRAMQLMAYIEKKNEKRARKQAIQDKQMQDQADQNQYMRDKDLEATKGKTVTDKAQIDADATKYAADKAAQSKENVKQIQVAAETPKQEAKTQGAQQIAETKKNLENQEAFPA